MKSICDRGSPTRFLCFALPMLLPIVLLLGLIQVIRADFTEPFPPCEHFLPASILPADALGCQQARNRVLNPDFELGIDEKWIHSGECLIQDGLGYDSPTAVGIVSSALTKKSCMVSTPIDQIAIEPGRFYTFSTRVRTDLVVGSASLAVTFWRFQGTWKMVGDSVVVGPIADTQDGWAAVTGYAQAPENASYVRVEALLNQSSQGTVWFDDVYFGLATCLSIRKSCSPPVTLPGQWLTYTITYRNTGRETVHHVDVVETYDKDVEFESAQPLPCNGSTTLWCIDELEPGEEGAIQIVVQVDQDAQDRGLLFNSVAIYGRDPLETDHPITTLLTTPVLTGTCDVYLDPRQLSQIGIPGQVLTYELMLRNAGNYGGQCALEADSRQDWPVGIDPPTCTLPVVESASFNMHLTIPLTSPAGSYSTVVTAMLACDCIDGWVVFDSRPLNTLVLEPSFLPAIMSNYRDPNLCVFDPWAGAMEDNDSCCQAGGPLCSDQYFYGYPDDPWDYFLIDVPPGGLVADLTIDALPQSLGLQPMVMGENCVRIDAPGCWDPIHEDGYHLECAAASGRVYLAVYVSGTDYSHYNPYTLIWSPLR